MTPEALAKFQDRVHTEPNTGCWIWVGAHTPRGYGQFYNGDRSRGRQIMSYAHRVSYEHFVASIEVGHEIDHKCKQPSCVNPEHLEAVSHRENVLRSDGVSARAARKTHCPQGHPYSGENLVLDQGNRRCRTCRTKVRRKTIP
jgi:hypothetical protein